MRGGAREPGPCEEMQGPGSRKSKARRIGHTVVTHGIGNASEVIATSQLDGPALPEDCSPERQEARCEDISAGIDLGEVQLVVSHDGKHTHILNGRLLRSKRHDQNKGKARLDGKKKGSRRRKKRIQSKQKQCKKIKNQIKDMEHQQTTHVRTMRSHEGVQTVVIGDVRAIRQDRAVGSQKNQKLHQWSHGHTRHLLTTKVERLGMRVVLQEERDTSRTCPTCGHRTKSAVQGRHCGTCGYHAHRDSGRAMNSRYTSRGKCGCPHVGAETAPATGRRFAPHTRVARSQGRENVCAGNSTQATGLSTM
jgi:putative transposase